jgi:peptide/nickel transport system substrate-binding protein/oligopeptide transport system substrate-binding protein
VIDKFTLELALISPFFDFPTVLTYPALAPVPSRVVSRDSLAYSMKPTGNGAFMLGEGWDWLDGDLKLERFDGYLGEPALVNAVEFKFYATDAEEADESDDPFLTVSGPAPVGRGKGTLRTVADKRFRQVDSSGAMTALEKAYEDFLLGAIDYTEIPVEELAEARIMYGESSDGYSTSAGAQTLSGQEAETQFLLVNLNKEPLDDPSVRKAISFAIDRTALSEALSQGEYPVATGIVPPDVEGFRDGAWPAATHNVYRAKQLLAEAGYSEGKGLAPVSLVFGGAEEERLFKSIKADLEAVGIRAKLERWDAPNQRLSPLELVNNKPSLSFSGWIIDYPLMESFLTPFFTADGVYNLFEYSKEEVEEGITAARGTRDAVARVRAYQAVEDIIAEDMPIIPLLYTTHSAVCSDRTNDLYVGPDKIADLFKVWVSW